jgi:hypothetical protein
MAKLRREPIDAESIDKFLGTEDDFNFELSCLNLLKKQDVKVEHGGTYSDPVTNLNRQFDFRLNFSRADLDISLALECKNLKPFFPLVVSRVPRLEAEAFHEILLPPENVGSGLLTMSINPFCYAIRHSGENSVYATGAPVGKSTTQVGVKESVGGEMFADDSEAHEKWAQSIASAYGLVSEAASALRDKEMTCVAHFILPVLVVPNGTLWAVDYGVEGEKVSSPTQVDEIEFYLNHSPWRVGQMFSYTFSHLHFVTQTGLTSYVERLRTSERYYIQLFGTAEI